MRSKLSMVMFCVVAAILTLGQTQCPQWPKPPFDTTGLYKGTWQGIPNDAGSVQQVQCPLTLHLDQTLTAAYPGDHAVKGWVEIDYSCIEVPDRIAELPASKVNISGLLTDDGRLSLFSGGCGTGACAILMMAGQGGTTNTDAYMDTFTGNWSLILLLAGVEPFGISGTFDVDRWLQ